jgi:hypothetical protein
MINLLFIALLILFLRIGQDTLFLAKIDAFNRNNRYYSMGINFIEAIYGITVIKIILDLMEKNIAYVFIYGFGSILSGLVSSIGKKKLDQKLQGQRKYYARISLENDIDRADLVETLKAHRFEFTLSLKKYINGHTKTVIEGSLDNRARMYELKDILRGRSGKHVTILRAEDVYLVG